MTYQTYTFLFNYAKRRYMDRFLLLYWKLVPKRTVEIYKTTAADAQLKNKDFKSRAVKF